MSNEEGLRNCFGVKIDHSHKKSVLCSETYVYNVIVFSFSYHVCPSEDTIAMVNK